MDKLARNLRKPSSNFYANLTRFALTANKPLERNAVRLLQIEPHHKVLEVGFGPGHGLRYALNQSLRNGPGRIVGVEFSSFVCDRARKQFAAEISTGKVKIMADNVTSMNLPDSEFDKVFHTNSHLYWPDLSSACKELNRVMKPGAKMVTVMNLVRIEKISRRMGALKYAPNLFPEGYMSSLAASGFGNIQTIEVKRRFMPSLHAVICSKT